MKKRFSIIPRNLLLIYNKDSVLLQKGHSKKTHWANMYNGLGGHIEPGENVFSSAQRELQEEGGVLFRIEEMKLKAIISVKTYFDEDCYMFVFAITAPDEIQFHANEEGTLEWIKIDKLTEMENIAQDIKILAPLIQKLPEGSLLTGTSSYNTDRTLKHFDYTHVSA